MLQLKNITRIDPEADHDSWNDGEAIKFDSMKR